MPGRLFLLPGIYSSAGATSAVTASTMSSTASRETNCGRPSEREAMQVVLS